MQISLKNHTFATATNINKKQIRHETKTILNLYAYRNW